MDPQEAQILSARVADAFGIDRTVSRNVAEVRVGYKRYAYAYAYATENSGYEYTRPLNLASGEHFVVIRLPKGAPAMLIPGEVVVVPHASDPDGGVVAVATRMPARADLPPVEGHPTPDDEPGDRWNAWVARWLAARYPQVEQEIAAYRAPAKPYATSWDALMPDLQAWLVFAGYLHRQHVVQMLARATPADVCRAVLEAR